jgi:tRNA-dihydrouridine synthase
LLLLSPSVSLSLCVFSSGLYDCGVRVICVHGRTRGSTKHRRVGPADLTVIGQIAAHLLSYHRSWLETIGEADSSLSPWSRQIVVLANGNIVCPEDILRNQQILCESFISTHNSECSPSPPPMLSPPSIGGIMSAEGILKDPAIFQRYLHLLPLEDELSTPRQPPPPSLQDLFAEYCHLSQLYSSLGGWEGLNRLEARKYPSEVRSSCCLPLPHLLPLSLLSSRSSSNKLAGFSRRQESKPKSSVSHDSISIGSSARLVMVD